jgi:hypothetical protein
MREQKIHRTREINEAARAGVQARDAVRSVTLFINAARGRAAVFQARYEHDGRLGAHDDAMPHEIATLRQELQRQRELFRVIVAELPDLAQSNVLVGRALRGLSDVEHELDRVAGRVSV